MSEIQKWVLNLSTISVIVSVLLTFIKNDKANSGIKTVLALYILVSTLNPLFGNELSIESIKLGDDVSINPINTEEIIKNQTLENIIVNFNLEFKESNIDAYCKNIVLSENLQKIVSVEIVITGQSNEAEAVSLVKLLAGEKAEIIVQKEG